MRKDVSEVRVRAQVIVRTAYDSREVRSAHELLEKLLLVSGFLMYKLQADVERRVARVLYVGQA